MHFVNLERCRHELCNSNHNNIRKYVYTFGMVMFEHCSSQCFMNVDLDTLYLHIIIIVYLYALMVIFNNER